MSDELKPCPFCGDTPKFEEAQEHMGTQYEIYCDCGMSCCCIQISDLMTIEERKSDDFIDYQYGVEFIERARNEAIKRWNKRVV